MGAAAVLLGGLLAVPTGWVAASPAAAATGWARTWSVPATADLIHPRPVLVGNAVATIVDASPDTVRFRSRANGDLVGPTITLPADVDASAITPTGAGDIVVVGTQSSVGNQIYDDEVFVARYSGTTGSQMWFTTFGAAPDGSFTAGSDDAKTVTTDGAGAVYVASSSHEAGASMDAVVTKLVDGGDSATVAWDKAFDHDGMFDSPQDIEVSGTDVYLAGSYGSGVSPFYGWVKRLDTDGNRLESHVFDAAKYTAGGNASAASRVSSVEVSGGRVWVGGGVDVDVSASRGHGDGFVANFALDLSGEAWERFGSPFVQDPIIAMPGLGSGSDEVYDLAVTSAGVVAVGKTDGNMGAIATYPLTGSGMGFLRVGTGAAAKLYKGPGLAAVAAGATELYVAGGADPSGQASQMFLARLDPSTTPPTKPPTKPPAKPLAKPPAPATGGSGGYFLVESDGDLYAFGTARAKLKAIDPQAKDNNARGATVSSIVKDRAAGAPAVAVESTSDGKGLWVLLSNGRIVNVGTAPAANGAGAAALTKVVVGQPERPAALARLGDGDLWVFTSAGRIVPQFGKLPAAAQAAMDQVLAANLVGPILDAKPTLDGTGAYATGSDGGVFAYNAPFQGNVPGALAKIGRITPDQPVVGVTVDPDGSGYWLVASDGGVFAFSAPFRGALPALVPFSRLASPVNGMTPFGHGYLLVAGDGGVFGFSNRPFSGSASGLVDSGVVGITPV